jgi:penicillin-binding protein 1A
MVVATANRPVEQFDTQVPMPDWQLTPEEELYGDTAPDANAVQPMVDENGMPINAPSPQEPGYPPQQPMVRPDGTGEPTQQELDQAFPPQQQQYRPQPYPGAPPQRPRQPMPPPRNDQQSPQPSDPSQPRPFTT